MKANEKIIEDFTNEFNGSLKIFCFGKVKKFLIKALSQQTQQKQEIVKEIEKAQKKWKPCNDKNCGNRDECERANHYIETIWNPTFEELKKTLTK